MMVVQQVAAQMPIALDAKHLQSVDPFDPARHAIIFNTRLSPKAKLLMCTPGGLGSGGMCACFTGAPCCNIIQWDKLNARSYVRVYENSVQANYATTIFCGACIADVVFTSHMDKVPASMMHAKMCTPFHLCCCIQIAGDVIAMAPHPALNNCCCTCFRSFLPGLDEPAKLLAAIIGTREVFKQGARLPAGAMLQAPLMVRMQ